MYWLAVFYSPVVSVALTLSILVVIVILERAGQGHQILLGLCLFLYVRYMVWRGLYTLNTEDLASTVFSWGVYLAEAYGLLQLCFFTFQAWSPSTRASVALKRYPTVDMFVTIVDEPLDILKRTLVGCLAQEYPKDKVKVYVLDDGSCEETRALASALNCGYLRRPDRRHAKAGNLNHALGLTSGEFVAIFDVDHVPVRTFLKETMGFFQDEQVAFVQTPHHFYNPDIFQKNLRLEQELKNEQALFFRLVQPGRDTHNSAFFAGSGGVFRRSHLEEIGGVQTETLTEDLHTSLLLHAKGYKSCYLNKVLSAGLMPGTFQGHLKQRSRWATGTTQVLFLNNPFTQPKLTLAQRLDYMGSIYYFFHGPPRIVCLIAPLFGLFLGISPLRAELSSLLHFFFAYYLASVVVMRTVSQGTRNAFWSDIYEVSTSFATSWAVLKTLVAPRKKRPFEVTSKGLQTAASGPQRTLIALPFLVLVGFTVAAIITGILTWMGPTEVKGLAINLFWAGVNLLLLVAAIRSAVERPQLRQAVRLNRRFPCEILTKATTTKATTHDLNEGGLSIFLNEPLFSIDDTVIITLEARSGEQLILKGRIARQERKPSGLVEVGIQFVDLDAAASENLIVQLYAQPESWEESATWAPGAFQSFWAILSVFRRTQAQATPYRRRAPRVLVRKDCRFSREGVELIGATADLSYTGLSVFFSGTPRLATDKPGLIQFENIILKVQAMKKEQRADQTLVRFRVQDIVEGEPHFRELIRSTWQQP